MRRGRYETPIEAMAQIKDYVAFYPDRVDEIELTEADGSALVARAGRVSTDHSVIYQTSRNNQDMIMASLIGKTALVTGASRGIGRASALALAAAGAQVLVHYGRGAKEADGVVAEIRKAGGRADAIATDLAAADGASKLARQARSIVGDRLDILVANAGVLKVATIEETTVEDFDRLFAVNVRAPFFLVQQLLPIMSKGSSIVFLSSLAARAVVGTNPRMRQPRAPSTLW